MLFLRLPLRLAAYAWAAPWSLFGLVLGLAAMLAGARARLHGGALEFVGGAVGRRLARLQPPRSFSAMTLGHVILAVDGASLADLRPHEHVHVRQYERWGPLFVPAYLLSSLLQWLRGRDPYRENHFERQAYTLAPVRRPAAPR